MMICLFSCSAIHAESFSILDIFHRPRTSECGEGGRIRGSDALRTEEHVPPGEGVAVTLFDDRICRFIGLCSQVAGIAGGVRTVTRWFNGVSADLDADARSRVARLPFVKSIRPVAEYRGAPEPGNPESPPSQKPAGLSYGTSYYQLNTTGIVKLHSRGYLGDGIRVCILDSGFDNLAHPAFDSLNVTHKWDFVGRDGDPGGDGHGTEVLSVLAANDPGNMIGAAPHAEYILARTEIINDTDVHAEEDYWVAGLEWADSLGADIVNSSVGYTDFADGTSYSYSDLDGETAITTIAADIAVDKGMTVVVSARTRPITRGIMFVTG